ncbi:peptidoglycan-binding domain-containing protein [Streptomyces tsukubensis]|uniref:Peptidoglycan binding-like domain-containing protein n=1 Tax=Streptomyces tsukubensis TaxID=83656 RepID=A0A1V4A0U5_9ACTN|nr:peptidoglycan-binding domain-containing protein [Streptomyces tsukubensis]OON72632.1 hypothetical protein B1H18_29130 [Streptomyces tsukubensis]
MAQLQSTLRSCYRQKVTVDGIFGAGTRKAVVNVQKRVGITADGVYGTATLNSIRWKHLKSGSFTCRNINNV